MPLERVTQEAYATNRSGFFVVRTPDDWRSMWSESAEIPPYPKALNSSRTMLLVAVAEGKDTTSIKIDHALETGEFVDVWVKEQHAGDGCSPIPDQLPFDAATTLRIDKPVKVYVSEEHENCGPPPLASVQCRVGDSAAWTTKVSAKAGDIVECEMTAQSRGRLALADRSLTLGDMPQGAAAKITYAKGPTRGSFVANVWGTYGVRAEAADEAGRKGIALATVEAVPPAGPGVFVQLSWGNIDTSDDPDTFPRTRLEAADPRTGTCSTQSNAAPCEAKSRSAFTYMKLKPGSRDVPLSVHYTDERVEKGPMVCIRTFVGGVRAAEVCDPKYRAAGDRWNVGSVDLARGVFGDVGGTSTDASTAALPEVAKPASKTPRGGVRAAPPKAPTKKAPTPKK